MKDIYYTLFGYACILVLCVSVALLVSQNDADSSGAAWQDHGYAITFQSKLPGGITALILQRSYLVPPTGLVLNFT